MSWFIFALLSIFALAGAEISQKISLSHKVDVSAITNNFYVWMLQGIGGLTLALIFEQPAVDLNLQLLWKLLLVAVTYFAGGTFFYSSYKGNSPSISIISSLLSWRQRGSGRCYEQLIAYLHNLARNSSPA